MDAFVTGCMGVQDGVARLTDLGVIRVTGDDAARFLQGQLTQDVPSIPAGDGRLAALCDPRGRMLASFIACRSGPQDFLLVCSADLLAATLRRLATFVLRSRVALSDATAQVALYGLMGGAIDPIVGNAGSSSARGEIAQGLLAPLAPVDGVPRALWLTAAEAPAPAGPPLAAGLWEYAAVRSGVATVTAPVAGAFVPQMLNYESVAGVSFDKGCYPGQEVVARSQFRGAVKRRAFVADVAGTARAGDAVYSAAELQQPCGLVAQAAPAPGGGTAVIAVLALAALEQDAALAVGDAQGPALTRPRRPYPLREI